jgi:hypothetical protein
MTSTKTRGTRDNPYALDDYFVRLHHSTAGTAWRWRTEILVLAFLVSATIWLTRHISLPWAIVVMQTALDVMFAIPLTRRFATRRFWCVLTRHRFQRLCWEARLHTRSGRVPLVLWVRPTKVGERLFVWCRAGTAAEDFEQHTGELAAACYAREARVTRNTQRSQVVTIDIIRRDTLAATHQVDSPLARLSAVYADAIAASDDDGPSPWPQAPVTNDSEPPDKAA